MENVTKSFIIREEHAQQIRRLAEETGLSESAILRNILDRWDGKVLIASEDGRNANS